MDDEEKQNIDGSWNWFWTSALSQQKLAYVEKNCLPE